MSENSISPLTVARRRQELYGPRRTLGRETAKRLQQEDHIFQNFQKGVERFHSKGAFESITARDFKVKYMIFEVSMTYDNRNHENFCFSLCWRITIKQHSMWQYLSILCHLTFCIYFQQHRPRSHTHPSKWDSSAQHSTHLYFGSECDPLTSVVRSDYTAKPLTQVESINYSYTYLQ